MQNDPTSIFPSNVFGDVRALSFNGDPVTAQSVPPPRPAAAAPASWYTPGRIIGIVMGSVAGIILVAGAVLLINKAMSNAARKQRVAAGTGSGAERSALM